MTRARQTPCSDFTKRVCAVVRNIPKGQTMTYKEVAAAAGSPGAARAVGNIMKANRDKTVPCHRVVRSDGKPCGYNGLCGRSREAILKEEGTL